ncbi:MAG: terminase small subunit [Firmicutes bacterium]|nr:terminase small subunit [Bacillota bacterium]
MALTPKRKRFCEEYVKDKDAHAAAVRAGYAEKTAKNAEKSILNNVEVRTYLAELMQDDKTAGADEVIGYLSSVMRGKEKNEVLARIGGGAQSIAEIDVSARERLKAAELLGKRYNLFKDSLEVNGVTKIIFSGEGELSE